MFQGFNLKLGVSNGFEQYQTAGLTRFNQEKKLWGQRLEKYTHNGVINASKLQDAWFAQQHAEVFISHSHTDISLAASLAAWLESNFGVRSFIDSTVWGHASDLQKQLDDAYTKKTAGNYDYDASNRACAHVHMMLCGALSSMLNQTECVIFLNTPSSIVAEDTIKDQSGSLTASPWIYFELITTKFIEKKFPRPILESLSMEKSFEKAASGKPLNIVHKAEIEHLIDLNINDLAKWEKCGKKTTGALDYLYAMKF